jgi:hypothetical protein
MMPPVDPVCRSKLGHPAHGEGARESANRGNRNVILSRGGAVAQFCAGTHHLRCETTGVGASSWGFPAVQPKPP